jgi:hypothetical protein
MKYRRISKYQVEIPEPAPSKYVPEMDLLLVDPRFEDLAVEAKQQRKYGAE